MPYANARVNFGDILQAIEDRLVVETVVADRTQITWGLPEQIPQFSGPEDVLLVARNGQHEARDGGAAQLQMLRYVDIWYRSQALPDSGGGWKEFIKAAFVTADKIINAVAQDGFWPEDDLGNLLTVEPIKLVGDVPPDYVKPGSTFATYVCTLSCLYMPNIDPNKAIFPIPLEP
jgi:hypothetical protein